MRAMMQRFRHAVRRLYRDEQGAEGLEKLLILALVVLPLLAVLIFFAGARRIAIPLPTSRMVAMLTVFVCAISVTSKTPSVISRT